MVRTSVVKYPDVENKPASHCNVAEASINWCQLLFVMRRSYAFLPLEFCVSVICVLKKI